MRFVARQNQWQDDADAIRWSIVHPVTVYQGTAGRDHITGSTGHDDIDVSQGGDDRVAGKGGNDDIYLGAAFTEADRIAGGNGIDTVTLDGDYSAGLHITAHSLSTIETLKLEGGSFVITGELAFRELVGQYGVTLVLGSDLTADQSLNLDASAWGTLNASGGAGDDILHAQASKAGSYLSGAGGDDTLIGSALGPALMGGGLGADTIIMGNDGDIAYYNNASESTKKSSDTIENFAASGGRIQLAFDADTTTDGVQYGFHLGQTADRVGDVLFHYDAGKDETIVQAFTDHDGKADFTIHLTGNVALTEAAFILF